IERLVARCREAEPDHAAVTGLGVAAGGPRGGPAGPGRGQRRLRGPPPPGPPRRGPAPPPRPPPGPGPPAGPGAVDPPQRAEQPQHDHHRPRRSLISRPVLARVILLGAAQARLDLGHASRPLVRKSYSSLG